MLWLIWIVLMILVPVGAGLHIWWQLHRSSGVDIVPQRPAPAVPQAVVHHTEGTQAQ
jgi:hypothetical protein